MPTIATTTQFAFIDDLYDALVACAGLADVYVSTGPVDPLKTPKPDVLYCIGTFMDEDFLTLGASINEERYDVTGQIAVVRPGAGQAASATSRTRAKAILAEMETVIRATMVPGATRLGGATAYRLSRVSIDQAFGTAGALTIVDFSLRVRAQLQYTA